MTWESVDWLGVLATALGVLNLAAIAVLAWFVKGLQELSGAYFKGKGANLATKEDIGEITKITKNVEAEVAAVAEATSEARRLEREAILTLLDAADEFQGVVSMTLQSVYQLHDLKPETPVFDMRGELERLHDARQRCSRATHRILLFASTTGIQSAASEIAKAVMEGASKLVPSILGLATLLPLRPSIPEGGPQVEVDGDAWAPWLAKLGAAITAHMDASRDVKHAVGHAHADFLMVAGPHLNTVFDSTELAQAVRESADAVETPPG